MNKRGRRFAGWHDITGVYTRVPYVDDTLVGGTGRTLSLYQLQSDPELRQFRITNPPDFSSDINAVSLGLFKHMSNNWQLTASATWLRATGTLQEGQGGPGEAGTGVGIIQRGGVQFRQFGQDPNNFVNVDGRLKSDVEWQFKVQARLPAAGRLPGLRELRRTATERIWCGARAPCGRSRRFPRTVRSCSSRVARTAGSRT